MAAKASEEIREVWTAFKQDPENEDLRNRLIEEYVPLVNYHASKLAFSLPDQVDADELFSPGVFGLMDAIAKYDLSRKVKFETYSALRIQGHMLDYLRAKDWVPRLVRSRASQLKAARQAIEELYGRPATDEEVADRLNFTPEQFRKFQGKASVVWQTSLQRKANQGTGRDQLVADVLPNAAAEDPTQVARKKDLQRLVTAGLNRQERLLILLYYYEGLNMKQIGEQLGLSESRISQLHTELIKRLRDRLSGRRSEFI